MAKWNEIVTASSENRRELILNGHAISQRISESGLDNSIFNLVNLNFLNISDTCLDVLPEDVSKLINLQSLLLHSNKLKALPKGVGKLAKLKLLDVSRNEINELAVDFNLMSQLTSLNVSTNKLEEFPALGAQSKLTVLDLSHNELTVFPDVCQAAHLSEIRFNSNKITEISSSINQLTNLKLFDLSENKIIVVPAELSDITKLKEVNLKDNPISDRRLLKLIDQCRTKQVLDYVKQHGDRKGSEGDKGKAKGGKKGKGQSRKDSHHEEIADGVSEDGDHYKYKITVVKEEPSDATNIPVVRETDAAKTVRPHILCCVVTGLKFDAESFRKFIQMQTRLHDTVCEKRTACTIATHDLVKLASKQVAEDPEKANELLYDAKPPKELILKPLGGHAECTGAQLYAKLKAEAEQLRRDKKRNVYSGVHRYLYMLEGKSIYPCLVNSEGTVISFPPITNSDVTRMSAESTAMFVEATSSSTQDACRKALDQLLLELLSLGLTENPGALTVKRVRVTDPQGNLRAVYPSRADLKYEEMHSVRVIRE